MTKKRLSGRERDRLARQKGAANKRPVRKSSPPPQKKESPKEEQKPEIDKVAQEKKESPPKAAEPKKEVQSTKEQTQKAKEEPKAKAESSSTAKAESKSEEVQKKTETSTKQEEQKEEKEIKRSAPKTFSAIQKEGAAKPVKKQETVKGETKSSVMAEQTENQTQDNEGGDHSHLVENVSTKPLRFALLAAVGVVLIIFLSQQYGPSHDHGHSEATKTEESKPEEMNEEAIPVMEEAAEEAEAPAEESEAPAAESETSEDETTSSNEMGEAVKSASEAAALQKPIWGLATAAVKSESEAKQRASNLRSKGFDATYIYLPDYIPNGLDYYRVFIGPFPGEAGARKAQQSYDQSDAYIFSIK